MPAPSGPSPGGGAKRRTRAPLARRFTYRYVLALALFTALALTWKVTSDNYSQRVRELSQQLDKAAAQPSRLDRLYDLASKVTFQSADSDRQQIDAWASELQQQATQLEKTQEGLISGDLQLNLPAVPLSPEIETLYNGDPERLRQRVSAAAEGATTIAALRENTPANQTSRQGEYAAMLTTHDQVLEGLQRATTIYGQLIQREVTSFETQTTLLLLAAFLLVGGTVIFLFRPMARSILLETSQLEEAERIHRANNERQTFRNDLTTTLEYTTNRQEVLAAVDRALREVVPDNPAELLLVDAFDQLERATVSPTRGAAGCPVQDSNECPVLRRGQHQVWEPSRMLNVCPKLPRHDIGECSAVCAPMSFMGKPVGVLHVVGPEGAPPRPTQIERLNALAGEAGSRIGFLRSQDETAHQARTDELTGLDNRRTVIDKASRRFATGEPFSLVMADLDHFKSLNDTHGHEAGDRALQFFARYVTDNLRPDDICGRFGGEEFLLLLPGTRVGAAVEVIERLQRGLADHIEEAGTIPFTVSFGLTDTSVGSTLEEVIAAADAALYDAKRNGRNMLMVDGAAARAGGMTITEDQVAPVDGDRDGDGRRGTGGDGSMPLTARLDAILGTDVAGPSGH